MKVNILGGGPAGLYFAILMRQLGHDIEVWERNPKDNTFGWGVVFSARTLESLHDPDPQTHTALMKCMRTWENVDIVHRGVMTSVAGNRFSGVARLALLQVLQGRCEELGIRVHYGVEVEDVPEADLMVGADGVASRFRRRHRRLFQPKLTLGSNRYIWYGTRQPFGGLTLTFKQDGPDLFMAHSYKYSEELSTFIVEVDEPTWTRIRYLGEARARARLERVFADSLGGHPLLSNRSRWIRFTNVYNQHWWGENKVLMGDALHTAHFSIGSGTKLAMEDAVALWSAFRDHGSVQAALPAYEEGRRSQLDNFLLAARTSQGWFENARDRMDLEVLPFAYQCMVRSSRLDEDILKRRDPAFVEAYLAASRK